MPIVFNEHDSTITINTDNTSYQMKIGPCNILVHTYYGPRINCDAGYAISFRDRGFSVNPYDSQENRRISSDTLPLEYPCEGSGDHRAPAFSMRRKNGAVGCDLRYVKHTSYKGKYSLPGLPAVYADEDAETLLVTLRDEAAGITATLQYGVLPKLDIITRAACITNDGDDTVFLDNAASADIDIVAGEWELIHFYGRHAGERAPARTEIGQREIVIGSRRGMSSHHENPFVILAETDTTELHGQCIGMCFVYSGSFACNVSKDAFGTVRSVMGIQSEHFDFPLAPKESFQAP